MGTTAGRERLRVAAVAALKADHPATSQEALTSRPTAGYHVTDRSYDRIVTWGGSRRVPTQTFLNLPEQKRKLITDLAAKEFAAHTYHQASLSRIVERAGIAKGSMYQYFAGKFDLYLYILELGSRIKLEAIDKAVSKLGPGATLYDRLMAATEASFKLAETNPQLYAIGMNLLRETDKELVSRVMERLGPTGDNVFLDWLQWAVKKGDVDPQASPLAAGYLFSAVTMRLGQDLADGRMTLKEALPLIRQVLDILHRGLRPRAGAGSPRAGTGETAGETDRE